MAYTKATLINSFLLLLLLLGRNYVQVCLNEGIEIENENERRKIRTKLFNNLVDDDDVDMSATAHQIGEYCVCGEASAPMGQMMQIILMRQKLKY